MITRGSGCSISECGIRSVAVSEQQLTSQVTYGHVRNFEDKHAYSEGRRMSPSEYGKKYELSVYHIVKHCKLEGHDTNFNTQIEENLGGCSATNDMECTMDRENDIPIEIKKMQTPDWMQCSLQYDDITKKWIGKSKHKIPEASKRIFEELISNHILFHGKIPPFMTHDITHEEWKKLKSESDDFHDMYIDCPEDTIQKLYKEKGCVYIQISEKGLYHLGDDKCHFAVPEFVCEQQLRIRTKIHTTKDKKGYCKLSVTIACQPKHIKNVTKSPYSLDDKDKLPRNLLYCE